MASSSTKSQEEKDFLIAYLLQQQESYDRIHLESAAGDAVQNQSNREPEVVPMSGPVTSMQDHSHDVDGPGEVSRSSAAAGSHDNVSSRHNRKFGSQSEAEDNSTENGDTNDFHIYTRDDVQRNSGASRDDCEELLDVSSEISNNGAASGTGYHGYDGYENIEQRHCYSEEEFANELHDLLRLGSITEQQASNARERRQKQNKLNRIVNYNENGDNLESIGVRPLGFDSDGIPLNWTDDSSVSDSHDIQFRLVELYPGQAEYDKINEEFESSDLEVVRVDRLQNLYLLDRFKSEMEEVSRRRHPGFDLNIRYLYHGTKGEKERVCEEGLDQRLSRMGFFGKGIYFSDNPKKCIYYAQDMTNAGQAYILKCRVILGDSKCYAPYEYDSSLKREPEKENPRPGTWRYYDSVVGCPRDYNEFVVYENRKAMIEYIISFRMKVPDFTGGFLPQAVMLNPQSQYLYNTPPLPQTSSLSSNNAGVSDDEYFYRRLQEVRENVRQKRCQNQGRLYTPPTEDSLQRDHEKWKRVYKRHTNDETQEQTEPETPPGDSQFSDLLGAEESQGAENSSHAGEPDPVDEVMSEMIHEFVMVTGSESVETAKYYIEKSQMNVNNAIVSYYDDMK